MIFERVTISHKGEKFDVDIKRFDNSRSLKLYMSDGNIRVTTFPGCTKKVIKSFVNQHKKEIIDHYLFFKNKRIEEDKIARNLSFDIFYLGRKLNLKVERLELQEVTEEPEPLSPEEQMRLYIDALANDKALPEDLTPIKESQPEIERSYKLVDDTLIVSIAPDDDHNVVISLIKEFYKVQAQKIITQDTYKFVKEIFVKFIPEVAVRDMVKQWGNCKYKANRLSFNRRLIRLPRRLIAFIILHELAHFVHPNHGNDFHTLLNQWVAGREKEFDEEMKEWSFVLLDKIL